MLCCEYNRINWTHNDVCYAMGSQMKPKVSSMGAESSQCVCWHCWPELSVCIAFRHHLMCSNFHLVFCSRSNECSERKLSLAVLRCVRKSVFLCHCAELGSFGHFGGVPCIPFTLDVIDSSDILFRIKEEEERKKRTNDTKLLFFAPKCARIIRLPIYHVVGFTRQGTAAGTAGHAV